MSLAARTAFCVFAVLLATPAVLACEDPAANVIALREVVPAVVQPGDVVLELDVDSMKTFSGTSSPKGGDKNLSLASSYATFDVKRIVAGRYEGDQVTIPVIYSTCWHLRGPEGVYLVAGPARVDAFGTRYVQTRTMTAAEHQAQFQSGQKALN